MKDGIYSIRLTIDGKEVVARGAVRDGVFHGLGELEGMVGVFSANGMRPRTDVRPPPVFESADEGIVADTAWSRVALEPGESANDRAACALSLDDRLRYIGDELDRIGPIIRDIAAASVLHREAALGMAARRADLRRDADALMEQFAAVREFLQKPLLAGHTAYASARR